MGKLFTILFLAACWVTPAFAMDAAEQQKIDYLIHAVETLQNATFIRNGSEYDAQRAADHLRLKLRYAGRVKTADDFITCCATASSITGEKYQIKFQDGRVVEAATFLRNKLIEYAEESKARE